MSLTFGTSGLRGPISAMTRDQVTRYVQAYLAACDRGTAICVGRDLRPSSPRIAGDVMEAVRQYGCHVIDCGALPTPALALAAQVKDAGAIMVTGSHIPADRNGLKFYTRTGEINKTEEGAILSALAQDHPPKGPRGSLQTDAAASKRYIERYLGAFGARVFQGRRIGLYAHSAVGRDILARILCGLGADVVELGRCADFIPVDTEAVDPETRAQIGRWVRMHDLDALVSSDGDSDRPLLADETGRLVAGDILGQITARELASDIVVTPISSNSGVLMKGFTQVRRTRIGSPFVIAAMQDAGGRVAGYEANGGFLLGFEAQGPAGPIPALVTRDFALPLLVTLHAGRDGGIAALVAKEPPVATAADRLQNVTAPQSHALLAGWQENPQTRAGFLDALGKAERDLDVTDGLRMTMTDGDVIHVRASGNAPELRVYVETTDIDRAGVLLERALARLRLDI